MANMDLIVISNHKKLELQNSEIQKYHNQMQNKKGIKIKTKQVSLVDNIVSFFKKNQPNQELITSSPKAEPNRDASPRSTTPRKKIFNKTPQKAGKIKFNNDNNKSMDAAYELTFNEQKNFYADHQSKSHLSPPKKAMAMNKFEDTQFNKLILGDSHVRPKKSTTPQKTFLNDLPLESNQVKGPANGHPTNQKKSSNQVSDKMRQLQAIESIEKQLQHQKRLLQNSYKENDQLRKQNHNLKAEVQNLKRQIKSYELSNRNASKIEIISLQPQNPKSPFQQKQQKQKAISRISSKELQTSEFKTVQKKNNQMKESIPIMPETPKQYYLSNQSPKVQQMSYLSSDLKNLSQQGSILHSEHSYQNLPGFSMAKNKNNQLLSPLEKTVYERTMKPQKAQRQQNKKQQKQQISFSKTVGYLKGDQPNIQQISQQKGHNPFQQIASQSNKFLFNKSNQACSSNSFMVTEHIKQGNQTREWLAFNQSEGSLQYSHNSKSIGSKKGQEASVYDGRKPDEGIKSIQHNSRVVESRANESKQHKSGTQKLRSEQSKTYKFDDFNVEDEQSSYVDYF